MATDLTDLTAKVDALVCRMQNVRRAAEEAMHELMVINSEARALAEGGTTDPTPLLEMLDASSQITTTFEEADAAADLYIELVEVLDGLCTQK